MNYHKLVRDFADRSRANLRYIDEAKRAEEPVYETTQLINSCLGLLLFPRERFYEQIPKTPIEQLVEQGWPVPTVEGNFQQVENLRELIKYLRNAIAHCNVEFRADECNEIVGLSLENYRPGAKTPNWRARLSVQELRAFLDRFSTMIEEYDG